jgi:hypothetical protein
MVATAPLTSPVADETAIAACIFMLKACRIGVAIVPPPVPVKAARQADGRGHAHLLRALRRRGREHQAILEEALVDARPSAMKIAKITCSSSVEA